MGAIGETERGQGTGLTKINKMDPQRDAARTLGCARKAPRSAPGSHWSAIQSPSFHPAEEGAPVDGLRAPAFSERNDSTDPLLTTALIECGLTGCRSHPTMGTRSHPPLSSRQPLFRSERDYGVTVVNVSLFARRNTTLSYSIRGLSVPLALALAITACSESSGPRRTAPPVPSRPVMVESEDCRLRIDRCVVIHDAILRLQSSGIGACMIAGDQAWGRFNGDFGGCRDGSGTLYDMFVEMQDRTPLNGWVQAEERLWNKYSSGEVNLAGIAGLIAHEEMHHEGKVHPNDDSAIEAKQTSCTV